MVQQKVVFKITAMSDVKSKQKSIEAVDIYGVDLISADVKEHKITVIGEMDLIAVFMKLMKIGTVEVVSVCPAK